VPVEWLGGSKDGFWGDGTGVNSLYIFLSKIGGNLTFHHSFSLMDARTLHALRNDAKAVLVHDFVVF